MARASRTTMMFAMLAVLAAVAAPSTARAVTVPDPVVPVPGLPAITTVRAVASTIVPNATGTGWDVQVSWNSIAANPKPSWVIASTATAAVGEVRSCYSPCRVGAIASPPYDGRVYVSILSTSGNVLATVVTPVTFDLPRSVKMAVSDSATVVTWQGAPALLFKVTVSRDRAGTTRSIWTNDCRSPCALGISVAPGDLLTADIRPYGNKYGTSFANADYTVPAPKPSAGTTPSKAPSVPATSSPAVTASPSAAPVSPSGEPTYIDAAPVDHDVRPAAAPVWLWVVLGAAAALLLATIVALVVVMRRRRAPATGL